MSIDSGGARATRAIRALYDQDLADDLGVLHTAAVWVDAEGALHSMRIRPETPTSATDGFALALARARADVILTTGRILREEPALRFDAAPDVAADLDAWRRERLGRETPPRIAVLTRDGADVARHPALVGRDVWLLTGTAAARAGRERNVDPGPVWVGRPHPGLLDAIDWLRLEQGMRAVVVEAGPSTAQTLYASPGHVDELMLSTCRLPILPDTVRGARFPDAAARRRAGLVEVARVEREEAGAPWSFSRWRRVGGVGSGGG